MLKALLVTPRPSKQFFYHLLFRDAKKISRDDWVLDFATQGGKNYSLLSKGRYVGADINPGALHELPSDAFGVITDLRRPGIAYASFDYVISTHTLSHLAWDERIRAIKLLAGMVRPAGMLLFNITPREKKRSVSVQDVLESVGSGFTAQKLVRYRGLLDVWYEDTVLDRVRPVMNRYVLVNRFMRLIGLIIFICERLTHLYTFSATEAYCVFRRSGERRPAADDFIELLACPRERGRLRDAGTGLVCAECGARYERQGRYPALTY